MLRIRLSKRPRPAGDWERGEQLEPDAVVVPHRSEKETSAAGVMRSRSERPEPSTSRRPSSGTPACPMSPVITPMPAAVEPRLPWTAPSCFTSISATKLSLHAVHPVHDPVQRRRVDGGKGGDSSPATPCAAPPATFTPARTSAARKSCAAASEGSRDV